MEDLSELKLQSMNIYDLRQVAKDLGVPKPTTYKKEQLVSMVKMFLVDEASTDKKAKESKAVNKRIDEEKLKQEVKKLEKKKLQLRQLEEERLRREGVNTSENSKTTTANTEEYSFTFKKNPTWKLSHNIMDKKTKKLNSSLLTGYYFQDNNGSSFIVPQGKFSEDEAVFVQKNFVQSIDIRQGDFVECVYKDMPQYGRVLTEIDNLTDFDNRIFYESLDRVCENPKPVTVSGIINTSFVEGSRNILRIKDFSNYNEIVKSFKTLPKKFTFVQYDYDALPEFVMPANETFYTDLGEDDERSLFVFNLMISRIKRLVERKERVVLFIDEISKIVKFQNFILSYSAYDLKNNSLRLCKKLMNLAGVYKNNASVTVVALLRTNGFNGKDSCLENEFIDMNCSFYDI